MAALNPLRMIGWSAVMAICATLAAEATAQSGSIDTTRSRVYVYVGKTGAGHAHGVEGTLAGGEIHLSGSSPAGNLTFDLGKFAADTSAARQLFKLPGEVDAQTRTQVSASMLGESVLNVKKYPTAQFVVKRVQLLGQTGPGTARYQLDGDLMLHGTQRPLTIVATAETVEGLTRLRGRFKIKQTDFGIKPFTKFLGAVGVTDELQILGEIWVRP
jgi:polyisoprenoid-binding protein YceI